MQGSDPCTRNTPPASAARNFAGIVSRFFASSECSKVPWKAKAHESKGVQSIRGGGVGGAPPPRTGFATGTYPTSPHLATQLSPDLPQNLSEVRDRTRKRRISRAFGGGSRWGDPARVAHEPLQNADLHGVLPECGSLPTIRGAAWE